MKIIEFYTQHAVLRQIRPTTIVKLKQDGVENIERAETGMLVTIGGKKGKIGIPLSHVIEWHEEPEIEQPKALPKK